MPVAQVLLLLAISAVSDLALGQTYNGYINPLFLSGGQRRGRGRLYDPYAGDLRDNPRVDDYRRLPLGQDYRYDDYRGYQSPYGVSGRRYQNPYDNDRRYQSPYDSDRRYQGLIDNDRRYPNPYDSDRRYPNPYGGHRRYSNSYDGYRRYPAGLDGSSNELTLEDNRVLNPSVVGLSTTASTLDRGQVLNREEGLRERILGLDRGASLDSRDLGSERGLGFGRGQDLGFDRGQGLGFDRGQGFGFDRGQSFGLNRGVGMNRALDGLESEPGLDGRQILSTSSPELSVTVNPNGST